MAMNLFTIALIPAIAEEFIFRGVFQNIFNNLFRSHHSAIWVTAFLFSAIHFQFFGFIPRFILGLAFGYLYFWGRNIMAARYSAFCEQCISGCTGIFTWTGNLDSSPGVSLWKQAIVMPVPVIIIVVILFWFRNRRNRPLVSA